MQPLSRTIVREFATEFASGTDGFLKREIVPHFTEYGLQRPLPDADGPETKPELFTACVAALTPRDQRIALLDLCNDPPECLRSTPSRPVRRELKMLLYSGNARTPIGASVARLSLRGTRESWWKACSRLTHQPAAAVTAARSLLETTCKTILQECGSPDESKGDLSRLVKETMGVAGFPDSDAVGREASRVLGGLNAIVGAVAGLSNAAGDRHGLVEAGAIDDEHLAELVVNACGVVAVVLVQRHMLNSLGSSDDSDA